MRRYVVVDFIRLHFVSCVHSKCSPWSLFVFFLNAYIFLSVFLCLAGFDLCEVGQEEVVLKTGKQANRRTMHFALQSLLALFGKIHHLGIYVLHYLIKSMHVSLIAYYIQVVK